ncbi:MAG TPA: hypothetical protein VIM86_05255 [Thermodesulfobacteriota bacterium]
MLPGPGGRLSLLGALLALSGVLAIGYVSHRERDNAFCVSCHGPAGSNRPLHAAIFERYASSARPGPDMATAHAQASPKVRCIDCHGGTGVLGRARVLALSARDTALYLARWYREPEGMRIAPLRDADCTRCHDAFPIVSADEGEAAAIPFHGRVEHHDLPIACVACHEAHRGGDARLRYVRDETAVPQCRRCHEGFGEAAADPYGGY